MGRGEEEEEVWGIPEKNEKKEACRKNYGTGKIRNGVFWDVNVVWLL